MTFPDGTIAYDADGVVLAGDMTEDLDDRDQAAT